MHTERTLLAATSNGRVPEVRTSEVAYTTEASWVEANEHVLVVACTDPRFQRARKEFIEGMFGLGLYDPLIIPGGPAALLPSSPVRFFVSSWVKMLHGAHGFKRAIAFAHHDCRAYRARYPRLDDVRLREQQLRDLRQFRVEVAWLAPGIAVETYYAEPSADGHIQFLKVE